MKRQYDGYISCFSKKLSNIVTLYFGALFVGHCTTDDLVDHFFEFVRDLGLDFNLLVALGIGDPNVSKSFKSKLAEECQKEVPHTSWMLLRSIHIANNAFLEGIKCLKDNVNVDQFAIDLFPEP